MQQLISNIIARRNERVSPIAAKIEFLCKLQADLVKYNGLRSRIIDEKGELIEDSPFAPQLIRHPEMLSNIRYATTETLDVFIDEQIVRLERLQKRFARQSLSLQVFGLAGSGKSTFIQSVRLG